jgi:hypothetical protein
VYDPHRDLSDVVILDAQDFAGEPVATIRLPVRVPFGFHGGWAPDRITVEEEWMMAVPFASNGAAASRARRVRYPRLKARAYGSTEVD